MELHQVRYFVALCKALNFMRGWPAGAWLIDWECP
jgi:hypothetical protein